MLAHLRAAPRGGERQRRGDAVRARDDVPDDALPRVFGRISFFLNAGIRFVEEICKARAMTALWDELGRERYGVDDEKLRRFRYGVQVNSLGLTEAQPENNVIRIVLEALGVTLSKRGRCRALQLPAWNEALGLPRPWDQQWSLRVQQILAYETDLLELPDGAAGFHASQEITLRTDAGAHIAGFSDTFELRAANLDPLVIEAEDREEAIRLASMHPAATLGEELGWGIELRPFAGDCHP